MQSKNCGNGLGFMGTTRAVMGRDEDNNLYWICTEDYGRRILPLCPHLCIFFSHL